MIRNLEPIYNLYFPLSSHYVNRAGLIISFIANRVFTARLYLCLTQDNHVYTKYFTSHLNVWIKQLHSFNKRNPSSCLSWPLWILNYLLRIFTPLTFLLCFFRRAGNHLGNTISSFSGKRRERHTGSKNWEWQNANYCWLVSQWNFNRHKYGGIHIPWWANQYGPEIWKGALAKQTTTATATKTRPNKRSNW